MIPGTIDSAVITEEGLSVRHVFMVDPATASIYINLQVVFTALIGLPFGFGISWVQVLGGVIVVAAVVLLARGTSKPVPVAP